jgi:hypothetical protein
MSDLHQSSLSSVKPSTASEIGASCFGLSGKRVLMAHEGRGRGFRPPSRPAVCRGPWLALPSGARREPRSGKRACRLPLDRRPARCRVLRPGGPPAGATPPAPATRPHGPVPFGPPTRRRPCMTPLRPLAPETAVAVSRVGLYFSGRSRAAAPSCAGPGPTGCHSARRGPGRLPPQHSGTTPSPLALRPCQQDPDWSRPPARRSRRLNEAPARVPPAVPSGVSRAPCRFPVLRM